VRFYKGKQNTADVTKLTFIFWVFFGIDLATLHSLADR